MKSINIFIAIVLVDKLLSVVQGCIQEEKWKDRTAFGSLMH